MLSIRFLVVDKDMVVLGGNQRLRACQVAQLPFVYVVKADELSPQQLKEFVIKDNTYYGMWDRELLSTMATDREMVELGMDLVEVSSPRMEHIGDIEPEIDESILAAKKETFDNNKIKQIVVYYPAELYDKVVQSMDEIKKHMGTDDTPQVLLKLISYWKVNYGSR